MIFNLIKILISGFVDITNLLIENGAIVNAKGMENVTPLGIAAYSGNEKFKKNLKRRVVFFVIFETFNFFQYFFMETFTLKNAK